jgi:hypothetical protein
MRITAASILARRHDFYSLLTKSSVGDPVLDNLSLEVSILWTRQRLGAKSVADDNFGRCGSRGLFWKRAVKRSVSSSSSSFRGATYLERVQIFLEGLANRIAAILEPLAPQVCELVDRLDKLAPAPGYESMLVERGDHPLFARGVSYRIIGLAEDEARKAKLQRVGVYSPKATFHSNHHGAPS